MISRLPLALAAVAVISAAFVIGRWSAARPPAAVATPPAVAWEESRFEPARIELGDIPWNAEVPFRATFHNRKPEEVVIASIKADCLCTGVDPDDFVGRVIPPQGSLEISGGLNPWRRLGERTAEIELMLGSGAIYALSLSYNGFATYTFEPAEVRFDEVTVDVGDGSVVEAPVQHVVFRSKDAKVVETRADVAWLDIGREETGDGVTQLALRPAPERMPHGEKLATVHVKTDDPYEPEFSFRVWATGVSDLIPNPGHVFVRRGRESAVSIRDREGKPATIEEIEGETEGLTLRKRWNSSLSITADKEFALGGPARTLWVSDASGKRTRFFVTVTE